MKFSFDIKKKDPASKARLGTISTKNGDIQTPAFAVVGTKASVKALTPRMIQETGAQVVLANTYHLYLQPGPDTVADFGGFQKFMGWNGPTITDSGGFQVFSLGAAYGTSVTKVANQDKQGTKERKAASSKKMCKITEQGAVFKSYRDGSIHTMSPEDSMEIQWKLGADIIFAFDECTSPVADHDYQTEAMDRTHRWARRSLVRHNQLDTEKQQALFGVVQGGRFEDLRRQSAQALAQMTTDQGDQFDGFGIGGSFTKDDLASAVGWVTDELPESKPRHLLGIGEPGDIVDGVLAGCDLFDCVAPTRNARNGSLLTYDGVLNVENSKYRNSHEPVMKDCSCYTCRNFTCAYLSHLYRSKEILGSTLMTIHNVHFIVDLMAKIRQAIHDEELSQFAKAFKDRYYG